mmetsp:Transcript_9781/g.16245  ORF Transcript_9781/g.16245 Transcript_9781/m.16245 type:complete len:95 (+) Transcript_9781:137-421(+)
MSGNYLSDELINEMSTHGSDDILCTRTKRKRVQITPSITESTEEKPLSKSAQKKMEQLRIKKLKESKRSSYLKAISDHSISENQRYVSSCYACT